MVSIRTGSLRSSGSVKIVAEMDLSLPKVPLRTRMKVLAYSVNSDSLAPSLSLRCVGERALLDFDKTSGRVYSRKSSTSVNSAVLKAKALRAASSIAAYDERTPSPHGSFGIGNLSKSFTVNLQVCSGKLVLESAKKQRAMRLL